MEIFLTRGSEGDGTWLALPATQESIQAAYEWLEWYGLKSMETRIGGVNSSVRSLDKVLNGMNYDDPQIRKEVNFLDKRVDYLLPWQRDLYSAKLDQMESPDMQTIINASYYLDFEPSTSEEPRSVYDGIRLPDPAFEKDTILLLHLVMRNPSKWTATSLSLPATDERLMETMKRLEIEDFDNCQIRSYDELWDYLPVGCQDGKHLATINELLKWMDDKCIETDELMAVLEAECPRTMDEVERVFENTDNTCLYSEKENNTPEAFARAYLSECDLEHLIPHINFSTYVPAVMQELHATQTKQGILTINQRVCAPLPEELVTTRLFSPLSGVLFHMGEWGCKRDEVNADDLTDYVDEIERTVKTEAEAMGRSGLAYSLDNRLLRQRVVSMYPKVEQYEEKMWGVLEIQSRGELLPEELACVTEEWKEQQTAGWGESFEGREIPVDGGKLRVSFGGSDPNFVIVTEQVLKESRELRMELNGM